MLDDALYQSICLSGVRSNVPCGRCRRNNLPCIVSMGSSRCAECIKSHKKCVHALPSKVFDRLISKRDSLRTQAQEAERTAAEASAKAARLRKILDKMEIDLSSETKALFETSLAVSSTSDQAESAETPSFPISTPDFLALLEVPVGSPDETVAEGSHSFLGG